MCICCNNNPAWKSNQICFKVCDEITYSYPNLSDIVSWIPHEEPEIVPPTMMQVIIMLIICFAFDRRFILYFISEGNITVLCWYISINSFGFCVLEQFVWNISVRHKKKLNWIEIFVYGFVAWWFAHRATGRRYILLLDIMPFWKFLRYSQVRLSSRKSW